MSAPMFEQVKKSGICKTGSVLKGLNMKYDFLRICYFPLFLACSTPWGVKPNFWKTNKFSLTFSVLLIKSGE
jgi:hypothetical protein